MINSKSTRSNTGYKGVLFDKQSGKFRTRLTLYNNGNGISIGVFETLKEAVKARENFIKSLF